MSEAPPKPATFEHVIYIAASPEKVWQALTDAAVTRQWWRGHYPESDWKAGSSITSRFGDGSLEFHGVIRECDPPRRLSYEVLDTPWSEEFSREQPNRLTFVLESFGPLVRLTLINEATEKLVALVRGGWPALLSSLKSLLETGKALPLDVIFGPERNPGTKKFS